MAAPQRAAPVCQAQISSTEGLLQRHDWCMFKNEGRRGSDGAITWLGFFSQVFGNQGPQSGFSVFRPSPRSGPTGLSIGNCFAARCSLVLQDSWARCRPR